MENKKTYNMEEVALILGGLPENERGLLLSAFKLDALVSAANDDVVREHIVHWVDAYINNMSNLKAGFIHLIDKIHLEDCRYSYEKEMENFVKFRQGLNEEDKNKIDKIFDENPISVPDVELNSKLNYEASFKNMVISIYDELEKNKNDDEIFLGISNKLFDRMVSVVTDITQREYVLIEKRLYNTLERLSTISIFEADVIIMLKTNGIEIKSNVLDMLSEIGRNWGRYIDIEKLCIAKAIVGVTYVENVETFNVLMENWDKIMS
ncbi:hypothetical protein FYJ38_24485 [Clostridium sp. WB02_MRS01]|uniref:hypothetical protein n=1 Tax=Clostridium sp. WB02_MRS01 TaxID=2605777 RepID=UPI0012B3A1A4|nr:hypothetical protein [Clostridium sp. WB02_MRS01]MSS11768.1 hypothetical protein [Clostridium sp. WB02_MRS01]